MQARNVTCLGLSLIFTALTSRAQERPTPTSARVGSSQGGKINTNYGNAPLMFSEAHGLSGSRMGVSLALLCAPMAIFSAVVFAPSRRRKFHTYVVSAVMVMQLILAGCGGTGAPKSPALARTTAPGTYTPCVIATFGTPQHVTKLTLVVR